MGSPFGGDGGDIIVDPDDGCKILDEYVYLELWLTETCGRSNGTPGAIRDVSITDPSPRFTAPFRADSLNKSLDAAVATCGRTTSGSPSSRATSGRRYSTTVSVPRRRRFRCRTELSTRRGAARVTTTASRAVCRPMPAAHTTCSRFPRTCQTATSRRSPSIRPTPSRPGRPALCGNPRARDLVDCGGRFELAGPQVIAAY